MSHYFTYENSFDFNDSVVIEVITDVSHGFKDINELETISSFPHRKRCEFANTVKIPTTRSV